ncbi:MAG: hypothetical protein MUP69_10255 [Candidatus Atribacteria bacterium]|nr:hypothetical protein [Candidatus Atribacteria bacterium]
MARHLMDLTGQKFGRLTVIKRSYPNNKQGNANWLCKCECGKEKVIRNGDLKRGHTRSCGCLYKEPVLSKLEARDSNIRYLISQYKKSAIKRKIEWNLSEERFTYLIQQDCHYCGAKPNNKVNVHSRGLNSDFTFNGIDRIDNVKGYTIDNVVPCCKRCNYAKRDSTLSGFKDWIKRIYNKLLLSEEKEVI